MGLSVIIITKNEAKDLGRALDSVRFADEVIVLDSGSTDATREIAKDWGAKVFETHDWPGFGPQKNRALDMATQEWVLSLDADEWVEPDLAVEIARIVGGHLTNQEVGAETSYRFRRRSIFIDRVIRFGDWRNDRVVRLFRRGTARFTDAMIHESLVFNGRLRELDGFLGHFSVRSLEDSVQKMWRYNETAAIKIARNNRGGVISGILRALFSLFRGLVLRMGFLDGLRGIQLALLNAFGTYIRYSRAQAIQDKRAYLIRKQTKLQRFKDYIGLIFADHGFLRALYSNKYRLPGGLYRTNQPSPRRLSIYRDLYGIKTVINLRGRNEQLGWYRLEEIACNELGLKLVNIQVYSRGLLDLSRLVEVGEIIKNMELPALVHCKSGADRAGLFSVLYRHIRLGEPIESAMGELALKFGHSKHAKTGILDFFFDNFIIKRNPRESFQQWAINSYNKEALQMNYKSRRVSVWLVDHILNRE